MTDPSSAGFAKFIPGFDFFQNLASGAGQGSTPMPGPAGGVGPNPPRRAGHWRAALAGAICQFLQKRETRNKFCETGGAWISHEFPCGSAS